MLEKISTGSVYENIDDGESVEVLEFKDFDLENDCYAKDIQTVIYIDELSKLQSMQIDTFAKTFK